MQDTSIELQKKYHDLLMSMTGEQRFLMGISMFETARQLALASFPKNITELRIKKLLIKRFYGNELVKKTEVRDKTKRK